VARGELQFALPLVCETFGKPEHILRALELEVEVEVLRDLGDFDVPVAEFCSLKLGVCGVDLSAG
jgi:hypothetical protein